MDAYYTIVIGMYNFLALMVVWSFLSTTFRNPGFIPTGYNYDLTRMSRITYSLYQNIIKYQAANISIQDGDDEMQINTLKKDPVY